MDNYLQEALDRAKTLLRAAGTLLKKQEKSMNAVKEGVPTKIRVKFKGMDEFIEYGR